MWKRKNGRMWNRTSEWTSKKEKWKYVKKQKRKNVKTQGREKATMNKWKNGKMEKMEKMGKMGKSCWEVRMWKKLKNKKHVIEKMKPKAKSKKTKRTGYKKNRRHEQILFIS